MSESPPRWVLDTNVVLDLFHFDDATARPLRAALESGAITGVASLATLAEWERVLTYPEFGLSAEVQAELAARYACRVCLTADAEVPGLPRCRDPDDQKFLALAANGNAAVLVSKDRALLDCQRRRLGFAILSPAEAVIKLARAS